MTQTMTMSALVRGFPASGIRKMFERAQRYDNVVAFTFGEPDFDTPDFIKQAAKQALDDNQTRYVSNLGMPVLREAIAERYSARWNRPVEAENVAVAVGGMEALLLAIESVVNPGQDVLVPEPGYPNYLGQIRFVGANVVPLPIRAEAGFKLQAVNVLDRITENTGAIILNSPSNPLGRMIDSDELRKIVQGANERGVVIISDEVYEDIVFEGNVHTSVGQLDEPRMRHIVVNSFSKSFAMTGWRCGWLIADPELVAKMGPLKEGLTSCVAPFVQLAGVAALRDGAEFTSQLTSTFQERRDAVVAAVDATEGLHLAKPEGAFYAFIDIRGTGLAAEDFAHRLLDQERVCLVPGTAFGELGAGHVRLSFATSVNTIQLGFDRIARFISTI